MYLGAIAVSIAALAQTVQTAAQPNRCETARFEARRHFGQPVGLTWKVPSAFPTPAHEESQTETFQISCPDFSAEQKSALFGPGAFTIRGASFQAVISRIEPIEILEGGGCQYPAIHVDCWNESVHVVIGADRLTFKKDPPDSRASLISLADSVVGIRINNNAPRPVLFEGKLIPEVTFGPTDVIELSVKEARSYGDAYDDVHVCRIAIDVAARTVTLQSPPPPFAAYSSPDAAVRACSAPAAQTKKKKK